MIQRSFSYPSFRSIKDRESKEEELKSELEDSTDALTQFRHKDHDRTERLARLGSHSSLHIVRREGLCRGCCRTLLRFINYILEREEDTQRQDEIILRKSYAGFYYFVKWFTRSLFFLFFTTLGTIAGKEIGCAIKDHRACSTSFFDLTNSSPHLVASLIGLIFGLLIGQWIGRFLWDHLTTQINYCFEHLEKVYLYAISIVVYFTVTGCFALIFLLLIRVGDAEIVGLIIGGILGFICALLALLKIFCAS